MRFSPRRGFAAARKIGPVPTCPNPIHTTRNIDLVWRWRSVVRCGLYRTRVALPGWAPPVRRYSSKHTRRLSLFSRTRPRPDPTRRPDLTGYPGTRLINRPGTPQRACDTNTTRLPYPVTLRSHRVLFLSRTVPYNLYVESRLWMYRLGSSNPTSV